MVALIKAKTIFTIYCNILKKKNTTIYNLIHNFCLDLITHVHNISVKWVFVLAQYVGQAHVMDLDPKTTPQIVACESTSINLSVKNWCRGRRSPSVSIFAICKLKDRKGRLMTFSKYSSPIKWQSAAICLVRSWKIGFFCNSNCSCIIYTKRC